ncbi:hypothetical protein BpHYR1_014141, partial [Brachionus plicatilis]
MINLICILIHESKEGTMVKKLESSPPHSPRKPMKLIEVIAVICNLVESFPLSVIPQPTTVNFLPKTTAGFEVEGRLIVLTLELKALGAGNYHQTLACSSSIRLRIIVIANVFDAMGCCQNKVLTYNICAASIPKDTMNGNASDGAVSPLIIRIEGSDRLRFKRSNLSHIDIYIIKNKKFKLQNKIRQPAAKVDTNLSEKKLRVAAIVTTWNGKKLMLRKINYFKRNYLTCHSWSKSSLDQ